MKSLVVVENPKRWPFDLGPVEVVAARRYLVDPHYAALKGVAVYNLCRSHAYQSTGYYVSLLAAARGHRPMPSVATAQTLAQGALLRATSEDLDAEIERALSGRSSESFVLPIYFGRSVAKRHARLARSLFNLFPAPILVARFVRARDEWRIASLRLGAASDVSDRHAPHLAEAARAHFHRRRTTPPPKTYRYDLAVLWSDADPHPPSDERAIKRFIRGAERHGIHAEVIGPEEYGRLAEYDALFIRETTYVNRHTFRFATRAAAEGLVVIDHPESIVRATNKVYQAELFARHGIPAPRTLVLHEPDVELIAAEVGLPCVLKKPDGAFSLGVVKVETPDEARTRVTELLTESELIVAQEFVRSDFDWRVGVLDGEALYLCRYHMARGHWQIVSRTGVKDRYGRVEAVDLAEAPSGVVETAVRAATLFGDGLFGVDVKVVDGRVMVMEVNDNPNLDAGYEDAFLGDALWDKLALWFRARLDARGGHDPR